MHPELLRLGRATERRVPGRVREALGAQQGRAQELRGHPGMGWNFLGKHAGNHEKKGEIWGTSIKFSGHKDISC